MSIIETIKNWFSRPKPSAALKDWFQVHWDDEAVYLDVSPPGRDAWKDQFRWLDIERVCFQATDLMFPDEVYFFTSLRPESYLVPMEASGAASLWGQVVERGLFDAELAILAASAIEGVFCWPDPNQTEAD